MIDDDLRRHILGGFPPGTPLWIVAPAERFAHLLAEKPDRSRELRPLTTVAADCAASGVTDVLVEGLEDLADPACMLGELRRGVPGARLFVLISNAASLGSLTGFWSGPLPAHPLVLEEIEGVVRAGGWSVREIAAFVDPSFPPVTELPAVMRRGEIAFYVASEAVLARLRTCAYFVRAEPA